MIHKHEIPILEFDDSPQAVIMPTHEDLDLDLPARCIYAFLEEEIERYANAVEADKVGEFVSADQNLSYICYDFTMGRRFAWLKLQLDQLQLHNFLIG